MRGLSLLFARSSPPRPATSRRRHPPRPRAPAAKKLGIRPHGDTEIQPDMSQVPPDLQKVYAHIDENIDAHVENLQKWIRQPSISNSGEGIPESAEMVKGFFDELGCQQTQRLRRRRHRIRLARQSRRLREVRRGRREDGVDLLDVRHDADHAARCVDVAAVRSAARRAGAVQEGADRPRRHQLEGPADGAAERVPRHQGRARQAAGQPDLRRRGRRGAHGHRPAASSSRIIRSCSPAPTRCIASAARRNSGSGGYGGGSEGCVYVELTTSGTKWGRGPTVSDIHGAQQAQRRQPGVASHQDAGVARLGRRQHAEDRRLLREHRSRSTKDQEAELQDGARRAST